MDNTYQKLFETIQQRMKEGDADESYVAKMRDKGRNKICQKVGEEATEVVIAALKESKKDLTNESVDLLFHLFILWAERGIDPKQVTKEIERRMDISGLDEKRLRAKKKS